MDSKFLMVLALLLFVGSVIAGVVGYRFSSTQHGNAVEVAAEQAEEQREEEADRTPEIPAVYARRDLAAGKPLTEADVETRFVREHTPDTFPAVNDVLGRSLRRTVREGSLLKADDFAHAGPLARLLEPGERAVAVAVDEVIAGGGFLAPGDYVDVVVHVRGSQGRSETARVLLERVRVLSYGDRLGALPDEGEPRVDDPRRARSAVLAVSAEDTPRLLLAENAGNLRLAVRSDRDAAAATSSGGTHSLTDLLPAERSESREQRPAVIVHRGGTSKEERH